MFNEKGRMWSGHVAEIVLRGRVVGNEVREVSRGQNLYIGNTSMNIKGIA